MSKIVETLHNKGNDSDVSGRDNNSSKAHSPYHATVNEECLEMDFIILNLSWYTRNDEVKKVCDATSELDINPVSVFGSGYFLE